MLNATNFENKMMGPAQKKDQVNVEGKRISRSLAQQLRADLTEQMAQATDSAEIKRLAQQIAAIDKALK